MDIHKKPFPVLPSNVKCQNHKNCQFQISPKCSLELLETKFISKQICDSFLIDLSGVAILFSLIEGGTGGEWGERKGGGDMRSPILKV